MDKQELAAPVPCNKIELAARLACCNRAAEHAAQLYLGNKKISVLHQVMQNPSQAAALGVTPEQMEKIRGIPERFADLIRDVPRLSGLLYEHHKMLIRQRASRFCRRIGRPSDFADFESEAVVGFLEACRHYTDVEFEFTTYLVMCITNRLRRMTITKKGVNEETLSAYYALERELAVAGEPHSFGDIVEQLGIKSRKRIRALYLAIQQPLSEQDITPLSDGAGGLESVAVDKSAPGLDYDFSDTIDNLLGSMSDFEASSFCAWCSDIFPESCESLKEVAERFERSPQAANYAKERARRKMEAGLRHLLL